MKKLALFLVLLLLLSGCSNTENKTIQIAVLGMKENFYPAYQEGIERAIKDLNSEYSEKGYRIECIFYDDENNYEKGANLADALSHDESITAIIGSMDMQINKTTAKICELNKKLMIVPYFLDDSVYRNNRYNMIFSMCNSSEYVGRVLRRAVAVSGAKRIAVCDVDNDFKFEEMSSFLKDNENDGIRIVDCVNMEHLTYNFDEVYDRWEILGVDSVIMFPEGDEGFEILKKLKRKNPLLICGGDTAFDNSTLLNSDKELQKAIVGFIMSNEFVIRAETDEEAEFIREIEEEYKNQKQATHLDFWYFQGYNAVRMIGDTAIKNQTVESTKIAQLLSENGYDGLRQNFKFDEYGMTVQDINQYLIFDEYGYTVFNADQNTVEFSMRNRGESYE